MKIVDCISQAASFFLRKKPSKQSFKIVPGWNRRVKNAYNDYRTDFLSWRDSGRLKPGLEFERMKDSRKVFKQALKACKADEERERCISIEQKYSSGNSKSFWSHVKNKKSNIAQSKLIDGNFLDVDIVNLFNDKFLNDENGNLDTNPDSEFLEELSGHWNAKPKFYCRISSITLKKIIKNLNPGKGHDDIHSLFLKRASEDFLNVLAKFFNAIFLI